MEKKREQQHDYGIIGKILTILEILQKKTDECTTIDQKEIAIWMEEMDHPCSERSLKDYLDVLMRELNPEDAEGYVNFDTTIDDYRITVKDLEKKLAAKKRLLQLEEIEKPEKCVVDEMKKLSQEVGKKPALRKLRYKQLFSFGELNQIVEAVLFLKNIDTAEKKKLIRKLQTLSSENFPKHSPFISAQTGKISAGISGVFEDSRIDRKVVMQNLSLIRNAMDTEHKIAFHFNGYDEYKKLITRKNQRGEVMRYVANPYYVILYNGKYYLICSVDPYDSVAFYRIDLMSDITEAQRPSRIDKDKMVSEIRKNKRQIPGLPVEWDDATASVFQAEHMYMFYGQPCEIRLKIDRERYTLLHDYFGENYTFLQHIDDTWDEVMVRCVPKAMVSWAMQCAEYIEVLSPEELRADITSRCEMLLKRYKKEKM